MDSLYCPETRAARRLIEQGCLGKLYYARAFGWRRRGRPFVDGYGTANFVDRSICAGGAMFDVGIYRLAQILHLVGNPAVRTVSGATYQEMEMYDDRRKFSNFSVEEMALGWVRLGGGISFDIEEAWAVHYEGTESSKVLGSKGGVKLSPFAFYSTLGDMPMDGTFDLKGSEIRWHACFPKAVWEDTSQHHWVGALLGEVELMPTAEYALNAALISEGIYMSSRLEREVPAEEIRRQSVSTAIDPFTPEKVWG
jgi:predicted dehydrogenase